VSRGVRVSAVRLPQVHDRDWQGLVTYLIAVGRENGVSAYVGDGRGRGPAVHRHDAARLYRLALEKGEVGARYRATHKVGNPLQSGGLCLRLVRPRAWHPLRMIDTGLVQVQHKRLAAWVNECCLLDAFCPLIALIDMID
jgi:hypothetical protein